MLTAARSPWQNPFVERLIGSIRRDCLDPVIVLNESHLRRVLRSYVQYYHRSRCHLSLDSDAPESRTAHGPEMGRVVELPEGGGLHHRYLRVAASTARGWVFGKDRRPRPRVAMHGLELLLERVVEQLIAMQAQGAEQGSNSLETLHQQLLLGGQLDRWRPTFHPQKRSFSIRSVDPFLRIGLQVIGIVRELA